MAEGSWGEPAAVAAPTLASLRFQGSRESVRSPYVRQRIPLSSFECHLSRTAGLETVVDPVANDVQGFAELGGFDLGEVGIEGEQESGKAGP